MDNNKDKNKGKGKDKDKEKNVKQRHEQGQYPKELANRHQDGVTYKGETWLEPKNTRNKRYVLVRDKEEHTNKTTQMQTKIQKKTLKTLTHRHAERTNERENATSGANFQTSGIRNHKKCEERTTFPWVLGVSRPGALDPMLFQLPCLQHWKVEGTWRESHGDVLHSQSLETLPPGSLAPHPWFRTLQADTSSPVETLLPL